MPFVALEDYGEMLGEAENKTMREGARRSELKSCR